jgi:hypothetical protein
MSRKAQAVWLPKAKVIVCLSPGAELSEEEIEALEEYFLLLQEARKQVKGEKEGK